MKTKERVLKLTLILNWLKSHNADQEIGLINIPIAFKENLVEMLGSNREFKQDLNNNQVQKNFLYQRILLNREFAFELEEPFWWEQYHLVQARKIYFNDIRYKDFDPMESNDFQVKEKIKAIDMLNYLQELEEHLESKMKNSKTMMNNLTYLLGN